jgi:hypothetical protein
MAKLTEMIDNLSNDSIPVNNEVSKIQLQWKESEPNPDNYDTKQIPVTDECKSSVTIQTQKPVEERLGNPRLSKRQTKNPALRNQDFLW